LKVRPAKEENINAVIHAIPAIMSFFWLFSVNLTLVRVPFFLCSFLTFSASFIYHSTNSNPELKEIRRQGDIASIFWLIPGVVFEYVSPAAGLHFFCASGILAVPVMLGYANDFVTDTALIILSAAGGMLGLVYAGPESAVLWVGLSAYAVGLPFYFLGHLSWMHTVWHLFVCAGWGIHAWGKLWL